MRAKIVLTTTLCVLGLLTASVGSTAQKAPSQPEKLPWGAGTYGTIVDASYELDKARWDWVCYCGPIGPEGIRTLNRLVEINPRQRCLLQLAGNMFGGGLPENINKLTFLDYHLDPKRRDAFRAELKRELRAILTGLSKPENILAFTFLEELPGHWGEWSLLRPSVMREDADKAARSWEDAGRVTSQQDKRAAFPAFLKPYQKQIEQQRGKPLVWDEETWRYLGGIFTSTVNDIHRLIKEESGGKPVYYWLHNGIMPLEMLPKDWKFETAAGCDSSIRLSDIIRPGLCEGVMFQPSCEQRWQQLLPLLKKYNWRYFTQLNHPGAFRLETWDATLARYLLPDPWKQGYFFYCEGGGCARPSGLQDPEMGKVETMFKDRFLTPVRDPQEGTALRIATKNFTDNAANGQYLSEATPSFRPQAGKKYRWSVRLKLRDVVPERSGNAAGYPCGATMFLRWQGDVAQIGGDERLLTVTGTHDWQTYSGFVTAPPKAVNCLVYVMIWHGKGEACFTKVSLKAVGDDKELVGNGDFAKFTASPLKFDFWYHIDSSLSLAHGRHFCNKHHIGDDVVASYFKLAIELEKPPASLEVGKPFAISARLNNTRDPSYFVSPEAAAAKDVGAVLELPSGLKLVGSPKLEKMNLAAGKDAVWQWSVVADKPGTYVVRADAKSPNMSGEKTEISVTVR